MIFIKEGETTKVPGITSLYVSFDYKKEIVEVMRSLGNCNFDKKTSIWECPVTSLHNLIKLLLQYDEVRVALLDEQQQAAEEIKLPQFKTQPFPYQVEGIKYGVTHNKFLLLDVPGLGKTLQAIYIAETLYKLGKINNCLIISGKNMLKYNWKNEIAKHSDLSCKILGERFTKTGRSVIGTVKERIEDIKKEDGIFFTITNIETLRDKTIVKPINDKFDMIVVDECHVCKDTQSEQGASLIKLKAKYKIAMTGTMLLNSPFDCFAPLKFIEEEHSSFSTFRYYYGKYIGYQVVGYKNTEVLKKQIESCSIRRTKDLLELPDKTIIDEVIEMNPKQDEFYKNIQDGIVNQVDKVHITTTSLLAMITRLRQATSMPSLLTTERIPSSKIERCIELVDEIIENGNKVVVFSTFKEPANVLYKELKKYNPILVTGDTKEAEPDVEFQNNPDKKVLIGMWQKAGTGLTLTSASYAIFLDTPWNWSVYEQAQDRIYRIGTKDKVFIYNLICKDTIDERVKEIVMSKKAIGDYVIDDNISTDAIESLKKYIVDLK